MSIIPFGISYPHYRKTCIQVLLVACVLVKFFYDFCFNQILSEIPCNFLAINLMMKNIDRYGMYSKNSFLLSVIVCAFAVFAMASCKVTKPSAYFSNLKKDTTLTGLVSADYELKIMKGDRLSIVVSSLSSLEDGLFNSAAASGAVAAGGVTAGGFVVQQDGTVLLHRLGAMQVAGITRKELQAMLQQKLLAYMKEPIVQINFLNHKITVMGEVGKPGIINLSDEPLTVIDALILSGDVLPNGLRTNVAIIREEGSEKKVKHVNLENTSIFSSPLYYVQPNDIILVSAETEKFVKEERRKKLQTTLSLVASGVSFLLIILTRVIK